MIHSETINGTDWWRTWSDTGKNLLQVETNTVYGDSVIDHVSNSYTYREVETGLEEEISDADAFRLITDEEPQEGEDELSPETALAIILGRPEPNEEEEEAE